jgi:hypothetical protein
MTAAVPALLLPYICPSNLLDRNPDDDGAIVKRGGQWESDSSAEDFTDRRICDLLVCVDRLAREDRIALIGRDQLGDD